MDVTLYAMAYLMQLHGSPEEATDAKAETYTYTNIHNMLTRKPFTEAEQTWPAF